uniref:J domain-containing protein n=1 Tax=Clastoptera arizonana TaxID=38151 RepID=A0A1B6DZU7_9HEMI
MLLQRFNRGIILKNCITLVSATSQSSYSTRKSSETHYDVLKLPKTCSSRQIRDAFIKLSKESHPDRNSDPKTHEKFVRINEAYNTLIKPDSRAEYDYKIFIQVKQTQRTHVQNDPIYQKPFRDPSFYENRDRSKDDENKNQPYYGIKGINRVSNKTLVLFIAVFTFFGVGLQVLAIMHANKARKEEKRSIDDEGNSRPVKTFRAGHWYTN